jgi:hypothetical protein
MRVCTADVQARGRSAGGLFYSRPTYPAQPKTLVRTLIGHDSRDPPPVGRRDTMLRQAFTHLGLGLSCQLLGTGTCDAE